LILCSLNVLRFIVFTKVNYLLNVVLDCTEWFQKVSRSIF
jgi:hypothetical protein